MNNILLVLGSPRRSSYSSQIARRIVDDLKSRHPAAAVVVRNLSRDPSPAVTEAFADGRTLAEGKRSGAEAQAIARSDVLVAELLAADVVVLATPMHNFGISASTKAWLDQIVRPGVTFSYSAKGPEGLVRGKKAILVLARGGIYSDSPMKAYDFQEPYLRAILDFIGLTDIDVVRIEGVALGEDAVRTAVTSAKSTADDLVRILSSEASTHALAEAA
ncbi:MAG: FMN-dependent NADH-azoreductase [Pseudomonadota bacterium]|nr:FMN-dependent NADH-azoreductase [Pseudomonadota bacterium]